jgi:uncharacterized protein YcfL|tara:strand:+ start:239 stop:514 length:276 start_codon:yes stop_codon:yes gene_type:complete
MNLIIKKIFFPSLMLSLFVLVGCPSPQAPTTNNTANSKDAWCNQYPSSQVCVEQKRKVWCKDYPKSQVCIEDRKKNKLAWCINFPNSAVCN